MKIANLGSCFGEYEIYYYCSISSETLAVSLRKKVIQV